MSKIIQIEGLYNHYGSLEVKKENSEYFIRVSCELNNKNWKQVDKKLYDMIVALNKK